jgi:hypothetical protein
MSKPHCIVIRVGKHLGTTDAHICDAHLLTCAKKVCELQLHAVCALSVGVLCLNLASFGPHAQFVACTPHLKPQRIPLEDTLPQESLRTPCVLRLNYTIAEECVQRHTRWSNTRCQPVSIRTRGSARIL